jgi:uncharacterized protein
MLGGLRRSLVNYPSAMEQSVTAKVWAISDAAAGNRRQTAALAAALGDDYEPLILRPRAPWAWLAPRRLPAATHAFGVEFTARLRGPLPRLAIGCGRQAALATRLLRARGCTVVQILDPRLDPRHWDAVVAPAHDRLSGANVISTVGSLHPVDDRWLAAGRAAWPALAALPSPRTLLLLGGPTRDAPLGAADWQWLAATLDRWLERDGGSLLLAASRRTPAWLLTAARAQFGGRVGLHWLGEADGPNPYPGMLGWAERIIVSADSTNLLSEACATGVPVLTANRPRPGSRIARLHAALHDSGRLRALGAEAEHWRYPPLRETAAVAAALRERLGI